MFIAVTQCSLQQRAKSARRIICTGKPENGGISQTALSKEGQRARRCLFITGVGAGKILACQGFVRISPNFLEVFCATFAYKFSPTKMWRPGDGATCKSMVTVRWCP